MKPNLTRIFSTRELPTIPAEFTLLLIPSMLELQRLQEEIEWL